MATETAKQAYERGLAEGKPGEGWELLMILGGVVACLAGAAVVLIGAWLFIHWAAQQDIHTEYLQQTTAQWCVQTGTDPNKNQTWTCSSSIPSGVTSVLNGGNAIGPMLVQP